jgi:type IV secretory pathway VirB2 component (pilin)
MSIDIYLQTNFLRGIALIMIVLLGIAPLWMLFDWGVVTIHPYVSLVSIFFGVYIYLYQRKLRQYNSAG